MSNRNYCQIGIGISLVFVGIIIISVGLSMNENLRIDGRLVTLFTTSLGLLLGLSIGIWRRKKRG